MTTDKNPVVKEKNDDIASLLKSDGFKEQVAAALPTHLTPERFVRIAYTAFKKTPKLQKCSKESLFRCLLDLSAMGLEPDGRAAHLIPYGKECQLIIDYKGIVDLVHRQGNVTRIHADVVCDNDDFEYDRGKIIRHRYSLTQERGKRVGAYAEVEFNNGTTQCEVMTHSEIEEIRKASSAGNNGPWVNHWGEMAKKTVFRRLSKWLPLSPEIMEHLSKDDTQFQKMKRVKNDAPTSKAEVKEMFNDAIDVEGGKDGKG